MLVERFCQWSAANRHSSNFSLVTFSFSSDQRSRNSRVAWHLPLNCGRTCGGSTRTFSQLRSQTFAEPQARSQTASNGYLPLQIYLQFLISSTNSSPVHSAPNTLEKDVNNRKQAIESRIHSQFTFKALATIAKRLIRVDPHSQSFTQIGGQTDEHFRLCSVSLRAVHENSKVCLKFHLITFSFCWQWLLERSVEKFPAKRKPPPFTLIRVSG